MRNTAALHLERERQPSMMLATSCVSLLGSKELQGERFLDLAEPHA